MKQNEITADINAKITNFQELMRKGNELYIEAGKIIVDLVDNHDLTISIIAERIHAAGHMVTILANLERVGRNQMHQSLLGVVWPAARCVAQMPYSEQVRLLNVNDADVESASDADKKELIEFVIRTPDGTAFDTKLLPVSDLDVRLTAQVFEKLGTTYRIRTIAQQQAYIIEQEQKASAKKNKAEVTDFKYSIDAGILRVNQAGTTFTVEDLMRLTPQVLATVKHKKSA
jgi:hypothetical protein